MFFVLQSMVLKIMWASTSPWTNAGYGTVAKHVVYGLKNRGFDITMYTQQLLGGGIVYDGVAIAPMMDLTPYSATDMVFWYDRLNRNLLITHWDVWVLHPLIQFIINRQNEVNNMVKSITDLRKSGISTDNLDKQLSEKLTRLINWVPYVPIDAPLDDYTTEINVVLTTPATKALIAQSRFGLNEIRKVVGDTKKVYYAPHGVDTRIYKPLGDGERGKLKKELIGREDAFVFGFIGANESERKDIPGLIKAFSIFKQNNKDAGDAYLLIWSSTKPSPGRAFDLVRLARRYGVADHVLFPSDQPPSLFYPEEFMVNVYNSMDWFTTMSTGEGFNLPLLEAMACGVPVIAGDHSAHHELAFDGEPMPRGIPLKASLVRTVLWTPTHQEYSFIDPQVMADAMTKAYNEDRELYSRNAAAFAVNYDWDKVIDEYFVPMLNEIEELIQKDFKLIT